MLKSILIAVMAGILLIVATTAWSQQYITGTIIIEPELWEYKGEHFADGMYLENEHGEKISVPWPSEKYPDENCTGENYTVRFYPDGDYHCAMWDAEITGCYVREQTKRGCCSSNK